MASPACLLLEGQESVSLRSAFFFFFVLLVIQPLA